MKAKTGIVMIVTLCVEAIICVIVAKTFSVRVIEVMAIVGAFCTALLYLFTSGGGMISNYSIAKNAGATGIIHENESFVFKRGAVFLASVLFLLVGIIFFILLVNGTIPAAK